MIIGFPPKRLAGSYIPEPGDTEITVPPVLNAVTSFPGLLTICQSGSGFPQFQGPVVEESAFITIERTQPASSATAAVGIMTFKKGLYKLRVWASQFATFTPATQLSSVQFVSNDPGATTTEVLALYSAANVAGFFGPVEMLLNLPVDFFSLDLQQGTTGVGQTIQTSVTASAERLA